MTGRMIESSAILTKRKIEKLVSEFNPSNELIRDELPLNEEFDVFVSHSSSDLEFIKKVILFLKYSKGGINAYVDWLDPSMKRETDAQTAQNIKRRIKKANKFIYVVTHESLKSVWCSWEIGYADRDKGTNKIAILAIKPNNGRWKCYEYLQQYPWISYDIKDKIFKVYSPNGDTITLSDWLHTKE
jgi:hypothetical protein